MPAEVGKGVEGQRPGGARRGVRGGRAGQGGGAHRVAISASIDSRVAGMLALSAGAGRGGEVRGESFSRNREGNARSSKAEVA